jgi:hypothetical protein
MQDHQELTFKNAQKVEIDLEDGIKQLQKKLCQQKLIVKQLKWNWKHPYLNAFHKVFNFSSLILSENFCVSCETLHLDSLCAKCDVTYDTGTRYTTNGDILSLHSHVLPNYRGTLYCFKPIHMDDIKLVNHWNSIMKTGSWIDNILMCPDNNTPHRELKPILSIHSSHGKNIPRGKILTLTRSGLGHIVTYC